LAQQLKERFPASSVSSCGVGDKNAKLTIHDYSDHIGSEHATLLSEVIEKIHHGASRSREISTVRLDDYCRNLKIKNIEFLKIDVEGFEYKVLAGCGDLIRAARVHVVQFEFNEMNVISKAFMSDFFELLRPRYDLYRMLPGGLLPLLENQRWLNEQFTYQNILAIRTTPRKEVIL
jgi:FkbM family methyltransferase